MNTRTKKLIGGENFDAWSGKRIAVFGVGGVGGTAAEALVRSGIQNIVVVDFDTVSASNLNRQILFKANDIGKKKVEAAKELLTSINPGLSITAMDAKVDSEFFKDNPVAADLVIDAIDDVPAKLALAKYCQEAKIPFVMCLGMGNRLDPSKVILTKLGKTENDPLAKKIRQVFRKEGLDINGIPVVCSTETPVNKEDPPSSMMMVPSEAGLLLCYYALTLFCEKPFGGI